MLTKCEDVRRLGSRNDVKKPFENVLCQGRIQIFFLGAPNLIFLCRFFRWSYFEANCRTKTAQEGPGACSPGKFLNIYIL